jgi:hypothetical protein
MTCQNIVNFSSNNLKFRLLNQQTFLPTNKQNESLETLSAFDSVQDTYCYSDVFISPGTIVHASNNQQSHSCRSFHLSFSVSRSSLLHILLLLLFIFSSIFSRCLLLYRHKWCHNKEKQLNIRLT